VAFVVLNAPRVFSAPQMLHRAPAWFVKAHRKVADMVGLLMGKASGRQDEDVSTRVLTAGVCHTNFSRSDTRTDFPRAEKAEVYVVLRR
jgi:hypothetical protein